MKIAREMQKNGQQHFVIKRKKIIHIQVSSATSKLCSTVKNVKGLPNTGKLSSQTECVIETVSKYCFIFILVMN